MEEIVKYKTRKMYSKSRKGYVTLSDIKEAVQEGKTVKVTDYNGNDITATTLSKVVALTETTVTDLETLINRG